MMFQNMLYLEMMLFGVWIMINHMSMSIFSSLELRKYMIGGISPSTCKTIILSRDLEIF